MKERTSKIKLKAPKLRGTWGNVKPYTRIESDKKSITESVRRILSIKKRICIDRYNFLKYTDKTIDSSLFLL